MIFFLNRFFKLMFIIIAILLAACSARIPREVVELSYLMGKDLQAVHSSYRELIQKHFEGLRTQTISFLENRWVPVYLEEFIQTGGLVESLQNTNSKIVFEDVQLWVEVAIEEIEDKKKELLDPINYDEQALLNLVDQAFANLMRANAVITAHLNSIRKVQQAQEDILTTFGLQDLRNQIDKGLISASVRVQENLDKLKKVKGTIDQTEKKKAAIKKKLEGK